MQMQIKVIRRDCTKYYLKALNPFPIVLNFDYTQDFRDRLRKAQAWNRGNSVIIR